MHHGTCVTHVPWCMSGSLTCDDGENVPGIPGACAPAILRIWQEAHVLTHWPLRKCNLQTLCSGLSSWTLLLKFGRWMPQSTFEDQLTLVQAWCPTHYTPCFNEVERGVYWYHLVRLSVCRQNRVRSVSSTILIGSITYFRILSSNFRRCVACNAHFKIQTFEILANL